MQNKMRYFQLINPIKGKYPLIGEKEIYKEENNIQILILKRDIIANHPNEQMEIAHDLSLEDVQREQAYLDAKMEQEITFESHPISNIMSHYIVHSIKTTDLHSRNQYNRLSDLYESVTPLVSSLFNFVEGEAKVNQLKATYPELEFELKPIGD